ncbi:MAG TPA: VWA domain-containing protein [Candidatus Angelobacter sp.]|nr:VWA domain-containing protein [Candidatus Angelobacter sp.]
MKTRQAHFLPVLFALSSFFGGPCNVLIFARAEADTPAALGSSEQVAAQVSQSASQSSSNGNGDQNTFRVNVKLVNMYTTVTDSHGAPVANLGKDDFKIYEDGVEQAVSVFDKESELPLSIVVAVDTSESTHRSLPLEVASAKKFAHSIMRPVDRLSLFQFAEEIDQLVGFTADLKAVDGAINRVHPGAGTSLYDAIYLCSDTLLDRHGRKVLVLITDGGDTTSRTDYSNALRRAQEAEATIYSIIVVPVAEESGRDTGGEHALIQLSRDTGGKHYYAENSEKLDDAFRQISDELRTQYLIAYYPNRRVAASAFRRVEIKVNRSDSESKPFHVRHRAGYYTSAAR